MKPLLFLAFIFAWMPAALSQIVNDSCHQAIEINCGDFIEVDFGGYDPDAYDYFEDCGFSSYRKSVWYKIEGTGDIFHVSLCNFSAGLEILEGDCDDLKCLEDPLDFYRYRCGEYSDEKGFKSEIGKTYYLYCNTLNPNYKSDLSVQCFSPGSNNWCEAATPITTNTVYTYDHRYAFPSEHPANEANEWPDTWYTFTGTGDLLILDDFSAGTTLSSVLLKGTCDQYEVVPKFVYEGKTAFRTEVGISYLLSIATYHPEPRNFALRPVVVADNDVCSGARPYVLGDTIKTSVDSTFLNDRLCWTSGYLTYDRWYKFTGKDGVISFEISPYFTPTSPDINVLSGECGNLECVDLTLSNRQYSFKGVAGQSYWLNIGSINDYNLSQEFTISSTVNAAPPNDEFSDALPIRCQDTISGQLKYALSDPGTNAWNHPPGVWYKINGQGQYYRIGAQYTKHDQLPRPATDYYTLENGQLQYYQYGTTNVYTYLENDQTYYIHLYNSHNSLPSYYQLDTFEITIDCFPILENDICTEASVIGLQDTVQSSTIFSLENLADACSNASQSDGWYRFTGNGKLYDFFFEKSSRYQYVSLARGSCDDLECVPLQWLSASDTTYNGRVFLEAGEKYFLKVYNNSSNFHELPFRFYFQAMDIAENDECKNARELFCGSVVKDSLDLALAGDLECDGEAATKKGIWYTIEGNDQYYELQFPYRLDNGIYHEVEMTLFTGDCKQLICIDEQLKTFSNKYVFFAEAGKTYYLLAQRREEIAFTVSCVAPVDNDEFENAVAVNCDLERFQGYHFYATPSDDPCRTTGENQSDDIWFKIEGQDEFLYYSNLSTTRGTLFPVYTLVDGNLQCFGKLLHGRVFLPAGKTYYLRLRFSLSFFSSAEYDFDFHFSCHPKAEYDDCPDAVELFCGEEVEVDNTHATNGPDEVACNRPVSGRYPIWFKIIGDGQWKQIDVQTPEGEVIRPEIGVYTGNCDALDCLYRDRIFYAQAGTTYYVSMGGNWGAMVVKLSCPDPVGNDLCHNAQLIENRDTINASLDFAQLCDYGDGCRSGYGTKKVWYELIGNGQFVNLQLTPYAYNDHTARLEIYGGDCCTLPEVKNIYGEQHNKYFLTHPGVKYLIAVSLSAVNDDGRFQLIVDYQSPDNFSICENALNLDDQSEQILYLERQLPSPLGPFSQPEPVSWLSITGSGGVDTLRVREKQGFRFWPHILLDINNSCTLTREHYQIREIFNDGDSSVYTIPTVLNQRYLIALEGDQYQHPETIKVQLTKGTIPAPCQLDIPTQYTVMYGNSLQIPISVNGDDGPFDVTVFYGTTSRSYSNILNNSSVTYSPSASGYAYIKYRSLDCEGHQLINVEVTGTPIEECPPEAITCPDELDLITPHQYDRIIYAASFIHSQATISEEVKVIYRAGTRIRLSPGFHAPSRSKFSAMIQECGFSPLITENEQVDHLPLNQATSSPPTARLSNLQVFPNPFSRSATIRFFMPKTGYTSIRLYHLNGNPITQMIHEQTERGWQQTTLQVGDLPSGNYVLSLQTAEGIQTQLVSIVR